MGEPFILRDPMERASDNDAAWFQRHPHRKHRIRAPFAGEFGPGNDLVVPRGMRGVVAVRQLMPGIRVRLRTVLSMWPSEREASARAVFQMMLGGDIAEAGTALQ